MYKGTQKTGLRLTQKNLDDSQKSPHLSPNREDKRKNVLDSRFKKKKKKSEFRFIKFNFVLKSNTWSREMSKSIHSKRFSPQWIAEVIWTWECLYRRLHRRVYFWSNEDFPYKVWEDTVILLADSPQKCWNSSYSISRWLTIISLQLFWRPVVCNSCGWRS